MAVRPLDSKLSNTTLSRELSCAIFNTVWPENYEPTAYDKLNLKAYIAYYKEECTTLHSGIAITITHWDLVVTINHSRHEGNTKAINP